MLPRAPIKQFLSLIQSNSVAALDENGEILIYHLKDNRTPIRYSPKDQFIMIFIFTLKLESNLEKEQIYYL